MPAQRQAPARPAEMKGNANPTFETAGKRVQVVHVRFQRSKASRGEPSRLTAQCANAQALRQWQGATQESDGDSSMGGMVDTVEVQGNNTELGAAMFRQIEQEIKTAKYQLGLEAVEINPSEDFLFLENLYSHWQRQPAGKEDGDAIQAILHYLQTFRNILIPRKETQLWKNRVDQQEEVNQNADKVKWYTRQDMEAFWHKTLFHQYLGIMQLPSDAMRYLTPVLRAQTFNYLLPELLGPFGKPSPHRRHIAMLLDCSTPKPGHDWSDLVVAREEEQVKNMLDKYHRKGSKGMWREDMPREDREIVRDWGFEVDKSRPWYEKKEKSEQRKRMCVPKELWVAAFGVEQEGDEEEVEEEVICAAAPEGRSRKRKQDEKICVAGSEGRKRRKR
jgi:hypothetical protein